MPEGVVHWFDPVKGDAEVLRDGRAYRAPAGAVEPAARHAGARVHFDVEQVGGIEQAVDVRLRPSAWGSRRHRRFGTLAGARRFDTKGRASFANVHPDLQRAELHPLQVARDWATSVARGDLDGALALYSPTAAVHAGERSVTGRAAIERWLESTSALGCERHAQVNGRDGEVVVAWEAEEPGERGLAVRSRLDHGEVAEQWELEPEHETVPLAAAAGAVPLEVVHPRGPVDHPAEAQAREAVARAIATVEEPVLFARVKLGREPDPARERPAVAEALLDVNGDLVRAHATARSLAEAVDVLERRLRDRLEHRASRRARLHRSAAVAEPGEWRHGDVRHDRPPYFDRPPGERQLVRHKTFAVDELTCDEAVFDMDQLDYDFYLFVDAATGMDSIVDRLADGTRRMTRLRPSDVPIGAVAEPVSLSQAEVPVLRLEEAIERLGAGGEHHLFFADAASGRGCVLYHRYDGHYGVITPE